MRDIMEISSQSSLIGLDYLNFNPEKMPKIIRRDEVVRFGMDIKSMEAFMGVYGFSIIENLEPDEISNIFLKCDDGRHLGRLNQLEFFESSFS